MTRNEILALAMITNTSTRPGPGYSHWHRDNYPDEGAQVRAFEALKETLTWVTSQKWAAGGATVSLYKKELKPGIWELWLLTRGRDNTGFDKYTGTFTDPAIEQMALGVQLQYGN